MFKENAAGTAVAVGHVMYALLARYLPRKVRFACAGGNFEERTDADGDNDSAMTNEIRLEWGKSGHCGRRWNLKRPFSPYSKVLFLPLVCEGDVCGVKSGVDSFKLTGEEASPFVAPSLLQGGRPPS